MGLIDDLLDAVGANGPLLHDRSIRDGEYMTARVSVPDLVGWIDRNFIRKPDLSNHDFLITMPEDPVARDHAQLEALLSENAETIAAFAKDAESAVRIVAMMIGMK
jgi:hypothetical protein